MRITLTSNLTVHSNSTGAGWVSDPDPSYRSTYSILSLCISTLVICVWRSIHLDVPMRRQGRVKSFFRELGWKICALIVPELFLWAACMQLLNAWGLRKEAQTYLLTEDQLVSNKGDVECVPLRPVTSTSARDDSSLPILDNDISRMQTNPSGGDESENRSDDEPSPRLHEFTLTHGFYAAMGGYAFDFSNTLNGDVFLPRLHNDDKCKQTRETPTCQTQTRITITATGVWFLMKHAPHLIPDVPEAHITDRSDGGALGKLLLILQVSWFCTNCIARLAQHLPLSLLEVTTVAHGLCTLLTYAVWWAKPLSIAEPTLICGPGARETCALMKMCSRDTYNPLLGLFGFYTQAEMDHLTDRDSNAECVSAEGNTVTLVPCKQFLDGTNFMPNTAMLIQEDLSRSVIYRSRPKPWHVQRQTSDDVIELNSEDVCRWQLASEALRSYGMTHNEVWAEAKEAQLDYVTDGSTLHINTEFGRYGPKDWQYLLVLYPAFPAIYGCAHFLGWNSHFPTSIEHTLWRIAAAATTFWGAGVICGLMLVSLVTAVLSRCCSFSMGYASTTYATIVLMALLYATATGYLLVESVRQLLYLEPAAYQLPFWSNYWPHFG